jgi:hypothetical protein
VPAEDEPTVEKPEDAAASELEQEQPEGMTAGASQALGAADATSAQTVEETSEATEQAVDVPVEDLTEAKTLFSVDVTEDPTARTAMENLPHNLRKAMLCDAELTAQLRNASPPQDPELVPRQPLTEGPFIELSDTGFFSRGEWYNLSFRCEINGDATRVTGFALDIGSPVPRSEWKRRGFPGS